MDTTATWRDVKESCCKTTVPYTLPSSLHQRDDIWGEDVSRNSASCSQLRPCSSINFVRIVVLCDNLAKKSLMGLVMVWIVRTSDSKVGLDIDWQTFDWREAFKSDRFRSSSLSTVSVRSEGEEDTFLSDLLSPSALIVRGTSLRKEHPSYQGEKSCIATASLTQWTITHATRYKNHWNRSRSKQTEN